MNGQKGSILVLEDDVHFGASVVRMLGRFGYTARLVDDIDVALGAIERERPHLLLTDLCLVGGTGHDVVRTVRRHHPGLAVVVMSGAGTVDDVIHLFRSGVRDYLKKPFSSDELRHSMLRSLDGAEIAELPAPPPRAARELPRLLEHLREGALPAPPASVAELLELRSQPRTSASQVAEAVGRDAGLAAGVLRLANRADMMSTRPTANLLEACTHLGNRRILDLAQVLLMEGFLPVQAQGLEEAARGAWAHTLRAADLARWAGREGGVVDGEDAFLAALLHNLGELMLLSAAADLGERGFDRDDLLRALREQSPGDHEAAGELAARAWGLPRELSAIIAHHHQDPSRVRAPLRAAVVFGDEAARKLGFSYFGNEGSSPDEALSRARVVGERIGLDREVIDGWLEAAS